MFSVHLSKVFLGTRFLQQRQFSLTQAVEGVGLPLEALCEGSWFQAYVDPDSKHDSRIQEEVCTHFHITRFATLCACIHDRVEDGHIRGDSVPLLVHLSQQVQCNLPTAGSITCRDQAAVCDHIPVQSFLNLYISKNGRQFLHPLKVEPIVFAGL